MISDTELGQRGPLYRRLASTTIGSLFPGAQTVVKINANDSIKKAMQVRCVSSLISAREGFLNFCAPRKSRNLFFTFLCLAFVA
jgi:hypothetical protein